MKIGTDNASEQTAPTDVVLHPLKTTVLHPSRFGDASFARNQLMATIPNDTSPEDVLKPGFWKNVGRRVRIGDEISCRKDDLSWYATLIVVASDLVSNHVEVREIHSKVLENAVVENETRSGYAVSYEGLTDGWIITRVLDGAIMQRNLESRAQANYEILVCLTPKVVQ